MGGARRGAAPHRGSWAHKTQGCSSGSHLWCQEQSSEVNSTAFVGEKKKKTKKPICTPKCFPGCFVLLLSQRDAFRGLPRGALPKRPPPCPLGEAIPRCGFPLPASNLLQIIAPPLRLPPAQHEGKSRSTPRARRCPPRARPQQPL